MQQCAEGNPHEYLDFEDLQIESNYGIVTMHLHT